MIKEGLTKKEAQREIDKLREQMNYHDYRYYVLDDPDISDSAYDSLKKELEKLENEFPDLLKPYSPTQRVGGAPLDKFVKFRHLKPMLSFSNAFNVKDIQSWESRLLNTLDISKNNKIREEYIKEEFDGYFGELKIDGLAMELIYEDGRFLVGATRGDGNVGEDVTQNLKTIKAIPLELLSADLIIKNLRDKKLSNIANKLEREGLPKRIIVRGEVYMTEKEFKKVNKEREKNGEKIYANPRNLAAGSIRQLDPSIMAERKLDFFAYDLVTDFGQLTHMESHKILESLGFKVNQNTAPLSDLNEIQKFKEKWEKKRTELDYEIDGVVIVVNSNKHFEKLGAVGKAPRGAIAYKFTPEEATSKIEEIIISVGRTGKLTPVAKLRPVEVGGVTVSRATLHNQDEIDRLDARVGDTVIIGRAGDVIPEVREVLRDFRTGKEVKFKMPLMCPICKEKIRRVEGEAAHKCINKECPGIKREGLYHFVSKSALDIDGLGPRTIDRLLHIGLISDVADLFNLSKEDFLQLEGFAEKSAIKTVEAIKNKKEIPLNRFIFALGIPNVGAETAFSLARNFGTFDNFKEAKEDELIKISDIGKVVAKSISSWMSNNYNQNLLEKIKSYGVKIIPQEKVKKSSKFNGKTFVFTGSLNRATRDEAKELVRRNGGDVSSSVSKNIDYVVAGDEPGSKYEKAISLGINTLSEDEFWDMIRE